MARGYVYDAYFFLFLFLFLFFSLRVKTNARLGECV